MDLFCSHWFYRDWCLSWWKNLRISFSWRVSRCCFKISFMLNLTPGKMNPILTNMFFTVGNRHQLDVVPKVSKGFRSLVVWVFRIFVRLKPAEAFHLSKSTLSSFESQCDMTELGGVGWGVWSICINMFWNKDEMKTLILGLSPTITIKILACFCNWLDVLKIQMSHWVIAKWWSKIRGECLSVILNENISEKVLSEGLVLFDSSSVFLTLFYEIHHQIRWILVDLFSNCTFPCVRPE